MSLYCMCKITGDVPRPGRDSQGFGPIDGQSYMAPNRFGVVMGGEEHRSVLLGTPMEIVVMGAPQYVCHDDSGTGCKPPRNTWSKTKEEADADLKALQRSRKHYPAVDVFRCPNCGAEVVRDA